MNIIIISGRSGAGKSVALRSLEDMGYYCVDNLPFNLLPQLIQQFNPQQRLAISLDIRNLPPCSDNLADFLKPLKANHQVKIIFLDCNDAVLIRRYSDSRRVHPISQDLPLEDAISQETSLLEPLREQADFLIHTSNLSNHDLARQLGNMVLGKEKKVLQIIIQSFGFKYGIPLDADYVFDVRFLPNPYWDIALRPQTGLDQAVQTYLDEKSMVQSFLQATESYLQTWLPHLEANNRHYLTIAIGCTGGKHRSVYIAEKLGAFFTAQGKQVKIQHKTLEMKP